MAGAGVAVGVHVDVRVDAQPDRLAPALAVGQLVQQRQLARMVDDDAADIGRERLRQLRRRLVVAVEVDALGGEAGAQGDGQLAARTTSSPSPCVLAQRAVAVDSQALAAYATCQSPGYDFCSAFEYVAAAAFIVAAS